MHKALVIQYILCRIGIGVFLLFAAVAAHADSWLPPEEQTYFSPDGAVRLTVTPRDITSPLDYFEDHVEGREPAGVRRGGNVHPRGLLERRGVDGRWSTIWETRLVNEVAPVSALVANSGEHVVTFDNWHFMGHGNDAVVIYGPGGVVVRSLGLDGLMPEDYVAALPASVSSIDWGGDHSLSEDETRLILKIVIPGSGRSSRDYEHLDLALRLADGSVVEPRDPTWESALSRATNVLAERNEAERARREALITALHAPENGDIRHWNSYLREAFERNDPDWPQGSTSVTVLLPREDERHQVSIGWAREELFDRHYEGQALTFGSPSPDVLTTALTGLASEISPGALDGVRLFVAAGDSDSARIAAAFAHTGADYVQLDPAIPIPPRPEWVSGDAPRIMAEAAEAETEELMREIDALDEAAWDSPAVSAEPMTGDLTDDRWDAVAEALDDWDDETEETEAVAPH